MKNKVLVAILATVLLAVPLVENANAPRGQAECQEEQRNYNPNDPSYEGFTYQECLNAFK